MIEIIVLSILMQDIVMICRHRDDDEIKSSFDFVQNVVQNYDCVIKPKPK